MGKLFAVVVIIITIVSTTVFIRHTWWLPVDISTTGPAVDRQLDETMVGTGILFVASQILLGVFCVGRERHLQQQENQNLPRWRDGHRGLCHHFGRHGNFDV